MRVRPETTTSERQLLLAMSASGRPVSLAEFVRWRKDGLLPPLAAQGRGRGRGKSYYWREPDIFPQACAAFDLLAKCGRPDTAIRLLWLSGFAVPLPQLRRAWLHHSRIGKAARPKASGRLSRGTGFNLGFAFAGAGTVDGLLLGAALAFCGAIDGGQREDSHTVVALIEHAMARLGYAGRSDRGKTALHHLWTTICMMGSSLEAVELIAEADDDDMRAAQHYLAIAARFLQSCTGEPSQNGAPWSWQLTEQLGAPLFILILVLVRSGAGDQLERFAADMERVMAGDRRPRRQDRIPPARIATPQPATT